MTAGYWIEAKWSYLIPLVDFFTYEKNKTYLNF